MSKNYDIEMVGGITCVRYVKQPDQDDLCQSIDEAAAIRPSGLRLWDLSKCDMNLSSTQLEEVADYAKTKFSQPSKVAIIAA